MSNDYDPRKDLTPAEITADLVAMQNSPMGTRVMPEMLANAAYEGSVRHNGGGGGGIGRLGQGLLGGGGGAGGASGGINPAAPSYWLGSRRPLAPPLTLDEQQAEFERAIRGHARRKQETEPMAETAPTLPSDAVAREAVLELLDAVEKDLIPGTDPGFVVVLLRDRLKDLKGVTIPSALSTSPDPRPEKHTGKPEGTPRIEPLPGETKNLRSTFNNPYPTRGG